MADLFIVWKHVRVFDRRQLLQAWVDARRFADGFTPFYYYNMKHYYNLYVVGVLLLFSWKAYLYTNDKKKFPHIHAGKN